MSAEAPKPVEAPVAAEAPKTVEETPAVAADNQVEASAVAEPTPAVEEAKKEEVADSTPVKEEVKPVEEGILGYKGPGLLKSFIFQKKFFYFGSEPVDSKTLSSYLRGEKAQDVAGKNVAWAAHTGNGLLFFTKKASEKATPAGIFNLSEISDIAEEGTVDFAFTLGGHKHIFQASSITERDNWVAVLKSKSAEAKELAPTVVESEEYKKTHTELTKPAVVATATPAKVEAPKEEKAEEKAEEKKEAKEEKKEEKKDRKSRSASRKRTSIFGGFGIGKKEEKSEVPVSSEESGPAPVSAAEEPAVAPAVAAPTEPATPKPDVTEPTPAVEETVATAPAEKPAQSKRNSIFGTLQSRFSHKEKKPDAEVAPVVPAKEAEPVSETAPVIPAVESSEPLAPSVATPTAAPTESTEVQATNGEAKATDTPTAKSEKRKSTLQWLSKKEKTGSDEEGEKPKSPFAKLRATVKGKTSPKAEKVSEKPAPTEESAAETATPAVQEPEKVAPASTPAVTASA
ncbi:immunogenic protein [Drepanopeziza brunnea f. sp. 'multigermtubi' MB_m1]|uniref:Immunogenic protein n=1 Tax=Marssonina brunnea f. sp. multigermtubi (strain MB_m1) TaxID=1072389 RepID=K1WZ08_MARBU|nr:immunogenic protein [Drepanopeziza brunnea f. sp. 'multigermtubi' MB_m1]EKD18196.1 immunogenic protein [Drepanopeziza brunnea f. sp. 'multigermtubi' MB_m1]